MKFKDLPAAQFGRYGEKIFARMLRNLGAGVIATFKFSGENDNEAPAIELHDKRITLADLDVSMRGRTFSVEVKTYKEPQTNRHHRCLVHGVPVRLFDEYVASEAERGIPVHLGILEVSSGALLVSEESISKIGPRYACDCHNGCESVRPGECEFRKKWGNSYPQWYFRRDSFCEWARLEGEDLKKLQDAHERVSHALKKRRNDEAAPVDVFPKNGSAWNWACLSCNSTWLFDQRHVCTPERQLVEFWHRRLKLAALDDKSSLHAQDLSAVISRPIARTELQSWLGSSWSPEGDFAR